jgi:hypothetical protein
MRVRQGSVEKLKNSLNQKEFPGNYVAPDPANFLNSSLKKNPA